MFITRKLEHSGNGSRVSVETDEDFGYVGDNQVWFGQGLEEAFDGDDRKKFTNSKSHVLCHWQSLDDNNVLSHSSYELSDSVRVDSENVPSTISTPGSASKENEKNGKGIQRKSVKFFLSTCVQQFFESMLH